MRVLPGQDLVEWNGKTYGPMDLLSVFPDLKPGKYLGVVEGMPDFKAYQIRKDANREYLLIVAGGTFMSDKVIYQVME